MQSMPKPACFLCGTHGEPLYQDMGDRLFSAPGRWNLVRCPRRDCGILWLDPMPTLTDIGEAYQNYLTHTQDSPPRFSDESRVYLHQKYGYPLAGRQLTTLRSALFRLRFRRRVELEGQVFYLPMPARGGRLLDVGCGSGDGVRVMAALGWQAEGVEVDPHAITTARSKGLTVHAGTLSEQRFAENSFDAITMSHVIEHVHDPIALLAECRRILKPGGMFVTITPNANSLGRAFYGSSWVPLEPPRHLHIFTPQALAEVARRAGFAAIDATSTIRGGDWIVLASQMIRRTGRGADLGGNLKLRRRGARLLQAIEALALQFKSTVGEELVLKARKNG